MKSCFCLFLFFNILFAERMEINVGNRLEKPKNITQESFNYNEVSSILKELRSDLEVTQHNLDVLKKEVDILKKNMEIGNITLKDKISELERNLKKNNTKKLMPKEEKKNLVVQNKNIPVKKDIPKSNGISDKDMIKQIKELILSHKYSIALSKLDVMISKGNSQIINYAYYYKGVCFYNQKKYDDAAYNFLESYNKNTKSSLAPNALHKLSECFKAKGEIQKSKIILEKIKADFPTFKIN